MNKSILLAVMIVSFGFAQISEADVVVFKNGDRLTGKFVRITDEKIVFNSELTGEVTADFANVQNFWTDEPVEIHLKDGTVLKSKALPSEQAGQLTIAGTEVLTGQNFAFADVVSVNPTVEPKVKWSGHITAGLTSTHGNTFTENGSISFDATRRSEKDRLRLSGLYSVGRTKGEDPQTGKEKKVTTEESLSIGSKYDYFITEKFYTYFSANFKKDHVADLDRRIIAGLGVGYQWIESDKMNYSTDVGLSILCEQYTTRGDTTKSDDLAVQLGHHFDWQINKRLKFIHNLSYYPSVTGSLSDYFLTADAEMRLALTKSMFGSFKTVLDYDSTPADNIATTDIKYILGVGWNF